MRPIAKPAPYRRAASARAALAAAASGFSVSAVGARPAGTGGRLPTRMTPRRNVPVAMTVVGARRTTPVSSLTPATRATLVCAGPPSFAVNTRSSTAASITSSPRVAPTRLCISLLYAVRSICALGPRTAGPLEAFSTRNWMPARSAATPMRPSRASISRTSAPFASPPMEGLHDISPMVRSGEGVTSATDAPSRAAAAAASVPAWPPPITTTSKSRSAVADHDANARRHVAPSFRGDRTCERPSARSASSARASPRSAAARAAASDRADARRHMASTPRCRAREQ